MSTTFFTKEAYFFWQSEIAKIWPCDQKRHSSYERKLPWLSYCQNSTTVWMSFPSFSGATPRDLLQSFQISVLLFVSVFPAHGLRVAHSRLHSCTVRVVSRQDAPGSVFSCIRGASRAAKRSNVKIGYLPAQGQRSPRILQVARGPRSSFPTRATALTLGDRFAL